MNPDRFSWRWTVHDGRAARALTDPARRRFFVPFLGRARAVSDVARELGASVSLTLHHVRRFVAFGALVLTHEERRAGRAVKHYRAVADEIFVPFHATPDETLQASILRGERDLAERFAAALAGAALAACPPEAWGQLLRRGAAEGDAAIVEPVANRPGWNPAAPDFPALVLGHPTLHLDPEDAKALQRELFALYERYAGRGGRDTYLLRLGLAPERT